MAGESLTVRAWLFFYVANLRVRSAKGDMFVLTYRIVEGRGAWEPSGWLREEPGEFAAYELFDEG